MRLWYNPVSLGMTEAVLTRAAQPPDRIRLEEFRADLFLAAQTNAVASFLQPFERAVQFVERWVTLECKHCLDLMQRDLSVGDPVPCLLDPITFFEMVA